MEPWPSLDSCVYAAGMPYPLKGKLVVGKLNIDDSPQAAQNYGVSSIPTLMVFKGGEVVERFVGVQPKSRLQQALDAAKGA
jgi:thioredoxin 1